jgi:hypothetical protein
MEPGRRGQERSSASGQASRAAGGNQRGTLPLAPQGLPRWFPPAPPILKPPPGPPRGSPAQPGTGRRGTNPRDRLPRIVGLRPPSATLRAAHDSTARHQPARNKPAAHTETTAQAGHRQPGNKPQRAHTPYHRPPASSAAPRGITPGTGSKPADAETPDGVYRNPETGSQDADEEQSSPKTPETQCTDTRSNME